MIRQLAKRSMTSGSMLAAALGCVAVVGTGGVAQAEVIDYKFNFGADISTTAGYEDYVRGDVTYTAGVGHGFTFNSDSTAGQNGTMLTRDRGGDANPVPRRSLVLDMRGDEGDKYQTGGDPSPLYDPFTFRVDLPNGLYEIQVGMGDPSSKLDTTFHVGDTFKAAGNTNALDEAAISSMSLASGVFTSESEYKVLPSSAPLQFEVTEGYLLIGFRRKEGAIRLGGMNEAIITAVPEPGTFAAFGLAGGLLLIRRR